jgi:hypothetical protein
MYGQQLKPEQFQALDGLRRALSTGPAGSTAGMDFQLQDAAKNMDEENRQAARNQLTMLATPSSRRGNLNMAPSGEVYYPNEGTMTRIGMERLYGGAPGTPFGHQAPGGLGQLTDVNWAGFHGHFADKERMADAAAQGFGRARRR